MPFDIKTQLYLITFIECAFLLQVFEHKEARLGKVCPVRIAAPLLLDLKTYVATLPESTVPYLFLTQDRQFYNTIGKCENKGNNTITELRTIFQRGSQNSQLYTNRQNQSTTLWLKCSGWHYHSI